LLWVKTNFTLQLRPGSETPITDLYLAKFRLLPVGQRLNGWRDLPQTISARIPA
jgi:hypothetical protein